MIKWLKSSLCKFGFMLSMLGAGTMNSGCEMFVPEGQLMKVEADGVITEQEEQDLIKIMTAEHQIEEEDENGNIIGVTDFVGINKFDGTVQNFINDTDIFFNKEFEKKGLERVGISNSLHLYMASSKEEYKEKYKKTYAGLKEPTSYSGFYSELNHTIYVPKSYSLGKFYKVVHHEIGHSMRLTDDEFPSLANEMYSIFKLYALNKNIGSQFLQKIMWYLPRENYQECPKDSLFNYQLGALNFLIQANKMNGDLETTVDKIMNVPDLILEKEVKDKISEYPELRTVFMEELDKLLEKPNFRNSFDSLGDKDFREMKDFLQTYNILFNVLLDKNWIFNNKNNLNLSSKEFEKYNNPLLILEAINLSEAFLVEHKNPYFRAKIIENLSSVYDWQKINVSENFEQGFQLEDIVNFYELSKKIIDLNKDYPCINNFNICPSFMQEPREDHVAAYLSAIKYGFILINQNNEEIDYFLELGNDFIDKFYPDRNFEFNKQINKRGKINAVGIYGSWINAIVGSLYVKKMNSSDNLEDYVYNCDRAKKFYEYSILGSCEVIDDEKLVEKCDALMFYGAYDWAVEEIEKLGDCVKE